MLSSLLKVQTTRFALCQLKRSWSTKDGCPPPSTGTFQYLGPTLPTTKDSNISGSGDASVGDGSNQTFQRPKRPELPGKVRMGFIPEEWFQFFYKKTGVTGPYMLGLGLLTYLCSKEIYVMEHEYYSGLSLAIMATIAVKKLGPALAAWLDKEVDRIENEWKHDREVELKQIEDEIEAEKLEQWRAEGAVMLMDIKREHIELQIEAAYREAAMKFYKEVLQRLDYQVACANVQARMNQKNMVHWVVRQVVDEVSSTRSGSLLDKTIADLSAMAVRAKL